MHEDLKKQVSVYEIFLIYLALYRFATNWLLLIIPSYICNGVDKWRSHSGMDLSLSRAPARGNGSRAQNVRLRRSFFSLFCFFPPIFCRFVGLPYIYIYIHTHVRISLYIFDPRRSFYQLHLEHKRSLHKLWNTRGLRYSGFYNNLVRETSRLSTSVDEWMIQLLLTNFFFFSFFFCSYKLAMSKLTSEKESPPPPPAVLYILRIRYNP